MIWLFLLLLQLIDKFVMPETYYEALPADCPLADAEPVDNIPFYRFVKSNPATDEDFISHRKK